jgi:DNA-binding MarR family transcriptional regulator
MEKPTRRQAEYLAFIQHYILVNRESPAEGDIANYFGVSPPTVHQMILTLERRGFITRFPGMARSIQLLITPLQRDLEQSLSHHDRVLGKDSAVGDAVVAALAEGFRRQFLHRQVQPIADSSFAHLLRCLLDGVESGLQHIGATRKSAAEVRQRLQHTVMDLYISWHTQNNPQGADSEEHAKMFQDLLTDGHLPNKRL